ncbi:MAG: PilZ domain-containing protein [Myxococcota bacterium]
MAMGRRGKRERVDWLAYYEQRGESSFWGHPVEDLSEGGGFLRTSRPLPPGQRFELVLVDKGRSCCVQTRAEVVWRGRKNRHRGMGIRFEHNRISRTALRDLVHDIGQQSCMESPGHRWRER